MEEIVHQYIIATPLVGNSGVMEITTPTALDLITLVITVSFTMEVYLMTRSKYCLAFESFFKMLAHHHPQTKKPVISLVTNAHPSKISEQHFLSSLLFSTTLQFPTIFPSPHIPKSP